MKPFAGTRCYVTRALLGSRLPADRTRLGLRAAVLAGAVLSAGAGAGQQAYFSLQGEITNALGQHQIFFELPTGATTTDNLFFRSYNNAGATNAAGDTTLGGNIDSLLELFSFNAGGVSASNDDGAAGPNSTLDSLLSWPGVAPDGGGALPGTGLPAANDYRLTFSDLGNDDTGNWGVDLVGPASKIRLTQMVPNAANPGGVSVLHSLKFGTTSLDPTPATFDYIGLTDLVFTGDLVLNSRALLQHDQGEITVGGTLDININSVYNLAGGTLDLDGDLDIAFGTMNVSSPATLDRAAGTSINITDGGSLVHNPGTVFSGTDLSISGGGDASFFGFFGLGTGGNSGTISVDGTGSSFSIDSGFNTFWAENGVTATLSVTNDATASIDFAGGIDFARSTNANTTGVITVNTGGDLTFANTKLTLAEDNSTSTVTVTVAGAGSTITHTGNKELIVGGTSTGSATINISDNAVYTTSTGLTTIADTGSVSVTTGGSFVVNGDLQITGSLAVDGASGFDPNGNITVDGGSLSVAKITEFFFLEPNKTLTAQNAGQVTTGGNPWFVQLNQSVQVLSNADLNHTGFILIGNNNGTGSLNVSGSGSTFTQNGVLEISQFGSTGTVTVQDSASAQINGQIRIATSFNQAGANGLLDIKTGGDATAQDILIGHIDGNQGTGTINVNGSGSTLTQTGATILTLGNADTPGNGGVHTINVTNAGIFNTATGTTTINKTGTLNVNTAGVFNANGDVTINGGTFNRNANFGFVLADGKTFTARNDAQVQFAGYYYLDQNFVIESGADMSFTDAVDLGAGVVGEEVNYVGSDASLIVDGPGSTFQTNTTSSFNSSDWGSDGGSATVTVRNQGMITIGGTANLNLVSTFLGGDELATLTVQTGGQFNANRVILATAAGSDAVGQITVTGTGSAFTQTGASTLTVGATSATGSGTINVSDSGAFITGTGTTTINTTGTLKIDNGDFTANGAMTFAGGTLHTVITTGSEDPVQVNAGLTIQPGSTLKLELDPGLTPAENDVFAIIASTSPITTTFDTIDGRIIGGGLFFNQTILNLVGTSTLLAIVDKALPGDTNYDGDVDDSDLGTAFANYTGPVGAAGNKTWEQGDTNGDGDVDDSDLGASFANYTGPIALASVPEPASLVLLGIGGLLLSRRRVR